MTQLVGRPQGQATPVSHQRFIVSMKDSVEQSSARDLFDKSGLKTIEKFDFPEESFPGFGGDLYLVESGDHQLSEALLADPRVDYVELDQEFELDKCAGTLKALNASAEQPSEATREPNDLSSSLWGLKNGSRKNTDIDAPEAWSKTVGSRNGPIVAVLDTGIDLDHPDLEANIWTNPREIPGNGKDDDGNGVIDDVHGFDAYYEDGVPEDKDGHGTHCAGTIGAVGNNNKGVVGVNWEARIMPVKIFSNDDKPKTSTSAILRGISYATKNGARVTSNSWGGPGKSRSIERAFKNSSAFHVMAAGNESQDNDSKPHYPSNYDIPNNIAVAAITRYGELSDFSNYGKESVDIAAPGSSIYSTLPGGRYGYLSGTSMATPHVAGVAMLALALNPRLSNAELKGAILDGVTADAELAGKVASGGWLNANNTLDKVVAPAETKTKD